RRAGQLLLPRRPACSRGRREACDQDHTRQRGAARPHLRSPSAGQARHAQADELPGPGRGSSEHGVRGSGARAARERRASETLVGFDPSPLGTLYVPLYFTGGYAIDGNPSVPPYPASHGCVRVPTWVAPYLYRTIPYGETVYVY